MKLDTQKGWTEAIVDEDCDSDRFYRVAGILENDIGLKFTAKLEDMDSIYWDFEFDQCQLTIHYNIYYGISIFPQAFKEATTDDNAAVVELAGLLSAKV